MAFVKSMYRIIMDTNCEGFSTMLEKILETDDESSFVKLLQDHPFERDLINSSVDKCVDFGAKKCLLSLVRGDVSGLYPTLVAQMPDSGVTALAYAAHSFPEPHVIEFMLTHCGATSLVNVGSTIGALRGLPIHFVLFNLSIMDHIYSWYRGESLVKLIILLCLWETKPFLDSARLLAQYTDSINDIAWTLLKNGMLKQFAAMLLIAREKVIAPFDTGLTIYDYITSEIDSITEGDLSIEEDQYKCILMDARKFLAAFEAAGDDLSSYCSSMHEYVHSGQVRLDICGLLKKNRVEVCFHDINFRILVSSMHKEAYGDLTVKIMSMLEDSYDKNDLNVDPTSSEACPHLLWTEPKRSPTVAIPNLACLASFQLFRPPYEFSTVMLARLGSHTRAYSTRACQTGNIGRSLQHTRVQPAPRNLAYIAMKVIKGFKFA